MKTTRKSEETRERILLKGRELLLTGGFAGVGLKDILARAEVPKGSFYHYFDSKEAFGCALLEQYVAEYLERMDALIAVTASGGERIMRYFAAWLDSEGGEAIADRCLVVKLASEISDISDDMRTVLDRGVAALVSRMAQLLREGAGDGSLRAFADPEATARQLYAQWLGAAILSKLSRDRQPLYEAMEDTRARLLP